MCVLALLVFTGLLLHEVTSLREFADMFDTNLVDSTSRIVRCMHDCVSWRRRVLDSLSIPGQFSNMLGYEWRVPWIIIS